MNLSEKHGLQQIIKNFFFLFSGNVIGKGSTFIVLILLARWLNAEDFGRISYVLAVIHFFIVGFDGFDLIGIRETAANKDKSSFIATNISIIRFFFSIAAYLLLITVFIIIETDPLTKLLFAVFGIRILCMGLFPGWFFQGIEKMNYTAIGIAIAEGGFLALIITFFKPSISSLASVGWFQLIPYLFAVSGLWLVYFISKNQFNKKLFKYDWASKKFFEALQLSLSAVVWLMAYNWGFIVLRFFGEYEKIGIYSASHNIMRIGLLIINMMFFAFLPYFSLAASRGEKDMLEKVCNNLFKWISFLLVPVIILACYYSKEILDLAYSHNYSDTWEVFAILIPTFLLVALNLVHNRILIAFNDQKRLATAHILIGIIGAILSTLLIPFYGIYGNAIAILSAETFAIIYMSRLVIRHININFYKNLANPLFAGIILLIVVWGLQRQLQTVSIAIGLPFYVLTVWGIKRISLNLTKYNVSLL